MEGVQNLVCNYIRFLTESILLIFLFSLSPEARSQVKITDGSDPAMNANSFLELESTGKGLLIPRVPINDMSLVAPLTTPVPVGMMVYSLGGAVQDGFYYWNGSAWNILAAAVTGQWTVNGANIYYNTGNVGIGVKSPSEPLLCDVELVASSKNNGDVTTFQDIQWVFNRQ